MRVVLPTSPRSDPVPAIVVFRGGAYASSSGSGAGTAEWIATQGMVGIEAAYGARSTNTFYPRTTRTARGRSDSSDRARVSGAFLSPHTVNSHLRHIFVKLAINSRAELARTVAEQDTGSLRG